MGSTRSKLVTFAAVAAAGVGGAAIASAATSGTASPSGSGATTNQGRPDHDGAHGGHTVNGKTEKLLSGTVESKVRAAALAKAPGTIERVETNVDSSAPYEAHITKADGTEVEVQVNQDFTVAAVNAMGDHHP